MTLTPANPILRTALCPAKRFYRSTEQGTERPITGPKPRKPDSDAYVEIRVACPGATRQLGAESLAGFRRLGEGGREEENAKGF